VAQDLEVVPRALGFRGFFTSTRYIGWILWLEKDHPRKETSAALAAGTSTMISLPVKGTSPCMSGSHLPNSSTLAPPRVNPGGSIDGRSCQPQHGCQYKLTPRLNHHALVVCDVLVNQADSQRSLGRPNGERLEAARFRRKLRRKERAASGLREHEYAIVQRHRTIAITVTRNGRVGFVLACAVIVNAAMEIDSSRSRACDLEHELKAPQGRP
jgi:hypothetical protein